LQLRSHSRVVDENLSVNIVNLESTIESPEPVTETQSRDISEGVATKMEELLIEPVSPATPQSPTSALSRSLDPIVDTFIIDDLPVCEEQPIVGILGEGGPPQDLVHPEMRDVLPEPTELQARSLNASNARRFVCSSVIAIFSFSGRQFSVFSLCPVRTFLFVATIFVILPLCRIPHWSVSR